MSCRIYPIRGHGRTRRSPAASGMSASLKQSLAGDPALTVSRLLCPRRLDPLTEYLACVVPAFELGRKAGLGLPINPRTKRNWSRPGRWQSNRPRGDVARLFSLGVSHRYGRRFRSSGRIARSARFARVAAGSRQTADRHQPTRIPHHASAAVGHYARARRRVAPRGRTRRRMADAIRTPSRPSSKRFSMRRRRPCTRRAQTLCSRRRFTAVGRQRGTRWTCSRAAGIGDLAG